MKRSKTLERMRQEEADRKLREEIERKRKIGRKTQTTQPDEECDPQQDSIRNAQE